MPNDLYNRLRQTTRELIVGHVVIFISLSAYKHFISKSSLSLSDEIFSYGLMLGGLALVAIPLALPAATMYSIAGSTIGGCSALFYGKTYRESYYANIANKQESFEILIILFQGFLFFTSCIQLRHCEDANQNTGLILGISTLAAFVCVVVGLFMVSNGNIFAYIGAGTALLGTVKALTSETGRSFIGNILTFFRNNQGQMNQQIPNNILLPNHP